MLGNDKVVCSRVGQGEENILKQESDEVTVSVRYDIAVLWYWEGGIDVLRAVWGKKKSTGTRSTNSSCWWILDHLELEGSVSLPCLVP